MHPHGLRAAAFEATRGIESRESRCYFAYPDSLTQVIKGLGFSYSVTQSKRRFDTEQPEEFKTFSRSFS